MCATVTSTIALDTKILLTYITMINEKYLGLVDLYTVV